MLILFNFSKTTQAYDTRSAQYHAKSGKIGPYSYNAYHLVKLFTERKFTEKNHKNGKALMAQVYDRSKTLIKIKFMAKMGIFNISRPLVTFDLFKWSAK